MAHYIDRLAPRLERMARYYARLSGQDADDLLQEAWLGVMTAWRTLDESIGQPEQFLIRHARWRLLTHARRIRRRALHPLPPDIPIVDPASRYADIRIDLAAMKLAPMHHQIVAHLEAGLTWREIGDRLGCTSANIAYHMRQIRGRLSILDPNADIVCEDKSLS